MPMDAAVVALPAGWAAGTLLLACAILVWAASRAPWRRFASSEAVHVWYGSIFALVLLWSVRAVVADVVVIHLLGTAGFALASGGPLALIGGAGVVLIVALVQGTPLANVPLVFLLSVALPVAVALAFLRATSAACRRTSSSTCSEAPSWARRSRMARPAWPVPRPSCSRTVPRRTWCSATTCRSCSISRSPRRR
jgi:hypothetical protein